MQHTITIEYCPKCKWMMKAAYFAQEFLTTFETELKSVTLQPAEVNGVFIIQADGVKVFDRKEFGGFAEVKELKQMIRDVISPGKNLGHSDNKAHESKTPGE
jgi:selenoprotein W-related protein